jgi:prolyl oligopeptidase
MRPLQTVCIAFVLAAGVAFAAGRPPITPRVPVVDTYHGVQVTDDYRWLEDWNDPAVRAWSDSENAIARATLDHLPGREALRTRISEIRKLRIPRYGALDFAGGNLFALQFEPPRQQAMLVVMPSENEPAAARVLVDPNTLDATGGTSIDWFVPSHDGSKVAVSLSQGGSERGDAHVYDVATGREMEAPVPRVNYGTAGGSLAWDAGDHGFYYTRYPREGERPPADLDFYTQVYYHALGTPTASDRYEIGKDFPRIAEIDLEGSRAGGWLVANVQNGDGGEFQQYLRDAQGTWTQLTRYEDRVQSAAFGPGETLCLLSLADAPRGKVLQLVLHTSDGTPPSLANAVTLVPQGEYVIEDRFRGHGGVVPADGLLYLVVGTGGPQQVRVFDLLDGHALGALPAPEVCTVGQVLHLQGRAPDTVLYSTTAYLEPAQWSRWTAGNAPVATPLPPKAVAPGQVAKTALTQPYPIDFSDCEVVRDYATSADGTRIPMSIIRRKGTRLDGQNALRLVGYGGFGLSQSPRFSPGLRVWLDRGGVQVIANLRGGSEYGEEWHRAGNLTHKQNVFDDFIACAEYLVRKGYTNPQRLAIEGGSNGGLLMGAVLTQRPDLFQAVVSHVGIYDMLRVELSPNGAFNIPEFGTVQDSLQFVAMNAYSPYHHVQDGMRYPRILFLTGANDPRVDPMHSRKMTARLQAAGAPEVLLRTSATSGHGGGTPLDEQIEQEVDIYSFLFDALRMPPGAP